MEQRETRPSHPALPALRLGYFGAAPDTANLGVSALCVSVLQTLAKLIPPPRVTVFDFGRGRRQDTLRFAGGAFSFERVGAKATRRYWQSESFAQIRWARRFGGLGNPAARAVRAADAIFDISGGDSFTDLYGTKRFRAVVASKLLALEAGRPLILLPQTYGPYQGAAVRRVAADIVQRAALAFARDARSYAILQELAGTAFNPARHRPGVDVAFALETHPLHTPLAEPAALWLSPGRTAPTLGLNVSGLILNDPEQARARYKFRADYRACVLGFLRSVLRHTDANVLLVPHVLTPSGHYESDPGANALIVAALAEDAAHDVRAAAAQRVFAVPPDYRNPAETKWIIAQCDWFCGTRMHATIAGLSSGVPTAAIAYSDKTLGVFETCGQGTQVLDPRQLDTEEVVARLTHAVEVRQRTCAALAAQVPAVREQAVAQLLACVEGLAPQAVPP